MRVSWDLSLRHFLIGFLFKGLGSRGLHMRGDTLPALGAVQWVTKCSPRVGHQVKCRGRSRSGGNDAVVLTSFPILFGDGLGYSAVCSSAFRLGATSGGSTMRITWKCHGVDTRGFAVNFLILLLCSSGGPLPAAILISICSCSAEGRWSVGWRSFRASLEV